MAEPKPIKLAEAVAQIMEQLDGPIALDDLVQRVLELHPSKAKDPKGNIRTHLRYDEEGKTLLFLDRQTLIPMRIAMQGVRFRINISPEAARHGALPIRPYFDYFLRRDIPERNVQLLDQAGKELPVRIVDLDVPYPEAMTALINATSYKTSAFSLPEWFQVRHMQHGVSAIIAVEDWEMGRFRLEHDAAPRTDAIECKNRELAELLFAMLETSQNEALYAHTAIHSAYVRLADPRGYPGDHWIEVVERDPRMQYTGFEIRYSDYVNPLEAFSKMFDDSNTPLIEEVSFTAKQAQQIYVFKASLWHRSGIWRTIEIGGGQTLADLDLVLREAFGHDTWDHLGGFWKVVPRGKTKRVREVDLGDVDPLGEGTAAEVHLAGLGLQPDDHLKYVYDFGDWIEHRLTLETVTEPQANIQYPRITGRNKPRYLYCPSCGEQGRKTIAAWICIDCSNRQQRDIVACERCLRAKHRDHYAEEMLY